MAFREKLNFSAMSILKFNTNFWTILWTAAVLWLIPIELNYIGKGLQVRRHSKFGFLKGDTGKQALKLICLQFLQFLSNFNETLSISFFFRGRLNRALRSDLTPLHSAHFTTAQRGLCTDFQTFLFIKV